MVRILMIMEVSRKQEYIFGSKKLVENSSRSKDIAYITGTDYFREVANGMFDDSNLVYSGGGHTVLEFDSMESATRFSRAVTRATLERYEGLELFVKCLEWNDTLSASENLLALSSALEKKKSLRASSFKQLSFGIERKVALEARRETVIEKSKGGYEFPNSFDEISYSDSLTEELGVKDNFLAVVHIDGNAMGARVASIYSGCNEWDELKRKLNRFSTSIQNDYEEALEEMVCELAAMLNLQNNKVPIRKVVLAGDDVCFVAPGNIGLECAGAFIKHLTKKKNAEDGKNYSACAGVAIVHRKYPFYEAYQLAEELCSNAKRFGVDIDANGSISAIDWHIEYGQLKDHITDIRESYETEDGNRMELRPCVLVNPYNISVNEYCNYSFIKGMCTLLQTQRNTISSGKIKELREAIKQGIVETDYYIKKNRITEMLNNGFDVISKKEKNNIHYFIDCINGNKSIDKESFVNVERYGETEKRSIFFDAIEMIDNCYFFMEE